MKLIVVFATHRSGTNFLHSVLRQREHIVPLGELFHPQEAYGLRPAHLQRLGKLAGQAFEANRDPALLAWLHTHPVKAVQALSEMAARKEREALYFKVFFDHFTTPLVDTITQLAQLPDFVPVVLQRHPLDVYISNSKAGLVKTWKHADTTDLRIDLNLSHYAKWADKARAWYRQVDEALLQVHQSPWRATYEQDVDLPPDALAQHWATRLSLSAPGPLTTDKVLTRQDRHSDWRLKVNRPEVVEHGLRQQGLWDEALGYFTATAPAPTGGSPA